MKNCVEKIIEFFQKQTIRIGLAFVLISLISYLAYPGFRTFLVDNKIDANFIIGFFTVVALLLSLIQVSKDKKYNYNLLLIESLRDKGFLVIAKLLSIKNKGAIYTGTLKILISILGTGRVYQDTNNILSKEDSEKDMDMVAAYIDTLFPEVKTEWNTLTEKISMLGSISINTLLNYNENRGLIGTSGFINDALDNIQPNYKIAVVLNAEIDEITLKIRDTIVEKINSSTGEFKKTFEFKF